MSNRRQILSMGLGALVAPGAFAQQPGKVWRIGFLSARPAPASINADPLYKAFLDGMRDLGYSAGKNLVVTWRFGDGSYGRLVELAADLAATKVDVIVTHAEGTLAAQKATTTIPIVSAVMIDDPVVTGFAKSLGHPGGNITGMYPYASEFVAKYLELLMVAVPKASRIAVIGNPDNASSGQFGIALQDAAKKLKVNVLLLNARSPQEIELSYERMAREKVSAAVILPSGFYLQHVRQLAELAVRHRIPSIWGGFQYPQAGGLMSYGFYATENYRRAATFVDKILKGTKAGDLPIEQPMRYQFVINRKAANTLGIAIPHELLLRADEVIE